MPSAHAKLSPSGADRWVQCPGSVHAERAVVDTGSQASDEGTACHALLERCLRTGKSPKFFLKETMGNGVRITRAMVEMVAEVLVWVKAYMKEHPDSQLLSEREVDIGPAFGLPLTEDGKSILWGTADVIIYNKTELVIADAKFGFHFVEAMGNRQLTLYAIGAEHELGVYSFEQVRMVILQPQQGGAREECIPVAELHERREGLAVAVKAALDPLAPRRPSEKACRYCPAAPVCPAIHEHAMVVAKDEFKQIDTLSLDQLCLVLEREDEIRKYLDTCHVHALRLAQSGMTIPGWKVALGTKHRIWTDPKKAEKVLEAELGDEAWTPRKLITPAQAEKAFGGGKVAKEQLAPLIEKPEGEPKLVRADDARPAIEADFTAIE